MLKAGRDACLRLESHAGKACLGLWGFPHDKKYANEILRKESGPSKIRQWNICAAARGTATENSMDREGSDDITVHDSSNLEIVSDVQDVGESLKFHSSIYMLIKIYLFGKRVKM